jgi:zinc transport system permease protein
MPGFLDALQFEFMRHALLAGLLASVLCGLIGPFVVVKRLAFISDGISHAAFGGMGICFYFGIHPMLGAIPVALACAFALALVDRETIRSYDSLIGVLWAVGMAVGIVFVYKTPGYAPNLMTYLFGNILLVSHRDISATLALSAFVLVLLGLFFRGIVAVAFDEVFARVRGMPVRLLMALLLTLISLTVVILLQVVGIILVVALLTIPSVISLMLWRDLKAVLAGSVGIGVAITLGGLYISYRYDLPSGPAIILLGAVLLVAAYGGRWWSRRGARRRPYASPPSSAARSTSMP